MFAATLALAHVGSQPFPGMAKPHQLALGCAVLRWAALCCDGCTLSSRCHGERRQVASGVEEGAG